MTPEIKRPEFDPAWGIEAVLLCPLCGGTYLHERGVVVYHRDEDAKQVTKTVVSETEDGTIVVMQDVPNEDSGNPSGRRDGLVVAFMCENCGVGGIELQVAQHKGQTMMSWRCDGSTVPNQDEPWEDPT